MSDKAIERGRAVRPWLCLVVTAVAVCGAAAASGRDKTNSPALPLEGEKVLCELFVIGTDPHGPASEHVESASANGAYVMTGSARGEPQEGLCARESGPGEPRADRLALARYAWIATCRVLRAGMDDIEMEVDWQRLELAPGGQHVRAAGDRRTIRLREGEHHWLDFVDDPAADGYCPRSNLVGVRPAVREDPRLADRTIRYGLWFVDEAPDGTRLARHQQLVGSQGERADVAFEPLRWSIPGVHFANGDRAEVIVDAAATVLGRVRRDGRIALVVDVTRWFGVTHEAKARSGGIRGGGRKEFLVNPGERVALELPDPQPRAASWSSNASSTGESLAPGILVEDGALGVGFRDFFQGHTMRLIVTATAE